MHMSSKGVGVDVDTGGRSMEQRERRRLVCETPTLCTSTYVASTTPHGGLHASSRSGL